MVLLGDSIRYTNVLSKKYSFHHHDMNEVIEGFFDDIVKSTATVKGPFFYSINNVPTDEIVYAEFFMPVEQNDVDVPEGMFFHSYFNIEDMVTFCVYERVEEATEIAYGHLIAYIHQNRLRQVTPIFHVVSGDHSLQYVSIKIGIAPAEKEEPVWK